QSVWSAGGPSAVGSPPIVSRMAMGGRDDRRLGALAGPDWRAGRTVHPRNRRAADRTLARADDLAPVWNLLSGSDHHSHHWRRVGSLDVAPGPGLERGPARHRTRIVELQPGTSDPDGSEWGFASRCLLGADVGNGAHHWEPVPGNSCPGLPG